MKPTVAGLIGFLALASPLFGQTASPLALSGVATSARYCISADGANVHPLGWVAAGTLVSVTFESDIPLTAAVNRLELEDPRSFTTYGTPAVRLTTSTPGTMALLVGGAGQAGCYQYRAEIGTAVAAASFEAADARLVSASRPESDSIRPTAITGLGGSALHCLSGNFVANVHEIGRVEAGNRIVVTFESNFNPVAGAANVNLDTQRGTFSSDDDSGGGQQPLLNYATAQSGTLVLHVAGRTGSTGCYRYKVEIR